MNYSPELEATEAEVGQFVEGLFPTAPAPEWLDKHWHFCFQRGLTQFIHSRTEDVGCSIISNEKLAALYIKASGRSEHASDCSTSVAPAETPWPCDCT